jgi:hypothetical protein
VSPSLASREQGRRKQIVSIVLLIIILFQLIDLPGALMSHSVTAIGIAVLGLALCGLAMLFNHFGRVTVVSVLLILVVDLGCGLMLLTSPMGLDVGDLPVFDVLLVSELIAVSLLPALSVFPVALQIVVALITYFWVRSALRAIARADYVEEVAQLQQREAELLRREAERTRQLDLGSQHLLEVLVRAANGEHTVRAALPADNLLWRVSSALNILLIRLRRALQAEKEYQRLRVENARLTKLLFEARTTPQHAAQNAPHGAKPL